MKSKSKDKCHLTEKQQIFVSEYIIDWNASRAYQKAYPNATNITCRVNGGKLLTNTYIQEFIQLKQKDIEKEAGISKLMILKIMKSIVLDKDSTKRDKINAAEVINKMQGHNEAEKLELIPTDLTFSIDLSRNLETE